jgi:hypothetical protein
MKTAQLLFVSLAFCLASCSHPARTEQLRQQALSILAKRSTLPVPRVTAMCGAGSPGSPYCSMVDASERSSAVDAASSNLQIEMLVFMRSCERHRDELAAAIARDPAFIDVLLQRTVRAHDCYWLADSRSSCALDKAVPSVDAQIENMLAKTLAAAIRKDDYVATRETIWTAPDALSELDKLYDDDLRAYAAQDVGGEESRIVELLRGAHAGKRGSP